MMDTKFTDTKEAGGVRFFLVIIASSLCVVHEIGEKEK